MSETNVPDVFGQDLLSAALGESGLNLDEYFGNVPGNVLSQAMLDVGDIIGSSDYDFLDHINLSGDFSQDNSYIPFTAPNNSAGPSNYANVVDKTQVSGVRTTFLEQPQTLPSLIPQSTIFGTPGQILPTNHSQQFSSKPPTPLSTQKLQNPMTSPILLNLLNSGNASPTSSVSSVTDAKKELTKK